MKKLIFILTLFLSLHCQAQISGLFFGHNQTSKIDTAILVQPASASISLLKVRGSDIKVDWGDGNEDTYPSGIPTTETHNYSIQQEHTITITGKNILTLFVFNQGLTSADITRIENLNAVTFASNALTSIDITNNTKLDSLFLQSNSISTLDVSNNTELSIFVCGDNNVTTLDISNLNSLLRFQCASMNVTMTSLNVPSSSIVNFYDAIDCSLSESLINQILIDLDGSSITNGDADLNGNTAPSGAGITAKNNLIGKGWTVTTD